MGTTLRDQLSSAFEEHVEEPAPQAPATSGTEEVVPSTAETVTPADAATETAEQKAGRTAGRPRDDKGRLLPGKPQKDSAAEPGKASLAQTPNAQTVQAAPAAGPTRPPRPSSWKKDYWDHWDKLDPSVAAYIAQRETEAVKGVSTYKAEFDRLKPLDAAMQEFAPLLQQANIQPDQWIRNLGNAHKALATGNDQERLSMFLKLAQDYRVPVQALFTRGQDGQVYFNPQVQAYQPPQQAQQPGQDLDAVIESKLMYREALRHVESFKIEKDDKGQLKYPHFEALQPTMKRLLDSEIASTLPEAYDIALKTPAHADLYAEVQQQNKAAEEAERAAERAKQVQRARSQAVSPRGTAPTSQGGSQGPKGIRAALEDAYDQHAGSERV